MSNKRLFSLIAALVLLGGGVLLVSAKVSASAPVAGGSSAPGVGFDPQRTPDVDTARWVAMGQAYAKEAQNIQHSQDADVARWVAMGEAYAKEAQSIQLRTYL